MTEKYLLFDLSDERSKKLGEVISNPTCKKIVNFLAEKEASISDISRELGLQMNTVQYNIEKLEEAGIIEKSKHFWSVKGKKMPTYRVANKLIVISPKKSSIYSKLKGIVPIVVISGILTGFLAWYYKAGSFATQKTFEYGDNFLRETATSGAAVPAVNKGVEAIANQAISTSASLPWVWFALGGLIVILAFLLWNWKKL